MSVRAKFKVNAITDYGRDGGKKVEMRPVYSADPEHENKAFWEATPSGSIEMHIKTSAAEAFEVGSEYYVDFTPAT